MAKSSRNQERTDRIEAMRRESQRAERRRTFVVIAICAVVALAIVGATGWKLYTDSRADAEIAGTDLAAIGIDAASAGCTDISTEGAEGQGQHVEPERVDYPESPPAAGPHWSDAAEFGRTFYEDREGRPELEQLVHNLEHGYTILWYDETVADDSEQLQAVQDLATKFDVGNAQQLDGLEEINANKFVAAPWTSEDGEPFPDGKHVALTHWAIEGDDAVEGVGMGVRQYCDAPSGDALAAFMDEYPATNSPEPNAL